MENQDRQQQPAWKRQEYDRDQNRVGPIEVEVRNGDIDQALRELKNKMAKEGILAELKFRRSYEKPSEKKRCKHREALKKMRKSRGRKARVARQGQSNQSNK